MTVSITPVAMTASCATRMGHASRPIDRTARGTGRGTGEAEKPRIVRHERRSESRQIRAPIPRQNRGLRRLPGDRTSMRDETVIVHSGRHPEQYQGAVNPPVYHASTILARSTEEYLARRRAWLEEVP